MIEIEQIQLTDNQFMNSNRRYSSVTAAAANIQSPQSTQISQRAFSKNKIFSEKENNPISILPISTQPLKTICNVFKKEQALEFQVEDSVSITQPDIQQSQVSECGVLDLPQRPHESPNFNKQFAIKNLYRENSNIKIKVLKQSKIQKNDQETQVNFLQDTFLCELESIKTQMQQYQIQIQEKNLLIQQQQEEILQLKTIAIVQPETASQDIVVENKMEFSFRKDSNQSIHQPVETNPCVISCTISKEEKLNINNEHQQMPLLELRNENKPHLQNVNFNFFMLKVTIF